MLADWSPAGDCRLAFARVGSGKLRRMYSPSSSLNCRTNSGNQRLICATRHAFVGTTPEHLFSAETRVQGQKHETPKAPAGLNLNRPKLAPDEAPGFYFFKEAQWSIRRWSGSLAALKKPPTSRNRYFLRQRTVDGFLFSPVGAEFCRRHQPIKRNIQSAMRGEFLRGRMGQGISPTNPLPTRPVKGQIAGRGQAPGNNLVRPRLDLHS